MTETPRIPSYQAVNYSLRPAKQIERKMLVETLQRLSEIQRVETYRYVGFGSIYFSDFILFHRTLGISNMVSIEKEVKDEPRLMFNRPYKCIEIEFGESTQVLPKLDWSERTILWLDYDKKLSQSMLADVQFFCSEARSGSVIIVSVNSEPGEFEKAGKRLTNLKVEVGSDRVPVDITDADLRLWGTAQASQRIVHNEISQALSDRNGSLTTDSKLNYKQLFNFHYKDGARMLTTGGIIYNDQDAPAVDRCSFDRLNFYRGHKITPFLIEIPKLTHREIRHLDRQMPTDNTSEIEAPGIPLAHIESYVQMYRYFPNYAEIDL